MTYFLFCLIRTYKECKKIIEVAPYTLSAHRKHTHQTSYYYYIKQASQDTEAAATHLFGLTGRLHLASTQRTRRRL